MWMVAVAFLLTVILTPLMGRLGLRFGLTGVDVHKDWRPIIPKTGGLAIIFSVLPSLLISYALTGHSSLYAAFILPMIIAGSIGFMEDALGEINPKLKPLLLIIASLPILILGEYVPRPVLPFIGGTRLSRIYPVMVLAAYPIVCNAMNSMDILNGSMVLTSLPFFIVASIIFLLRGDIPLLIATLIGLASLIGFLVYNMYPARIFPGNSGSLSVGALIATIAIVGRIEVAAIIALLPHILNEMHVIFSMGGLRSAKGLRDRPVEVEGGRIMASARKTAPITLLRMIASRTKITEKQAVMALSIIAAYTSIMALITQVFFIGV